MHEAGCAGCSCELLLVYANTPPLFRNIAETRDIRVSKNPVYILRCSRHNTHTAEHRCHHQLATFRLNGLVNRAGSLGVAFDGAWWENGQLLMLIAAQCMAAGTLMVPLVTRYVDPVMATGWHMILGGMPLIALSLATEQPDLSTNLSQTTPGAMLGQPRIHHHLLCCSFQKHVVRMYCHKGQCSRGLFHCHCSSL